MADRLVTVGSYPFLTQAEAAQAYLEDQGIRVFLADATTVHMDWLLGNAIGYIKVQVADSDRERALELLAEAHIEPAAGEEVDGDHPDEATCLGCGAALPADQSSCGKCGWSYARTDAAVSEPSEDEEDETSPRSSSPGVLDNLRTVKRPLLWAVLAPSILGMIVLVFTLVRVLAKTMVDMMGF